MIKQVYFIKRLNTISNRETYFRAEFDCFAEIQEYVERLNKTRIDMWKYSIVSEGDMPTGVPFIKIDPNILDNMR